MRASGVIQLPPHRLHRRAQSRLIPLRRAHRWPVRLRLAKRQIAPQHRDSRRGKRLRHRHQQQRLAVRPRAVRQIPAPSRQERTACEGNRAPARPRMCQRIPVRFPWTRFSRQPLFRDPKPRPRIRPEQQERDSRKNDRVKPSPATRSAPYHHVKRHPHHRQPTRPVDRLAA